MSLSTGTRLGPYEILTPLGAGGMGEVYKARDTRLDRTVAIKVLPEHLSQKRQLRERFEREARAVSSLNHSHICALYDVGQQGDVDYLVMEYLEGDTLAQRLKKGPLPLDQTLRYAVEIAGALDHAHRHGVVHRDLKPGNIMLTKAGAKVLDFGLAKVHAAAVPDVTQPTNTLTEEGVILGTLQYMAPEQLEGKEADARSDIFAFGAVVYEMATSKKAFEGKSRASIITLIMSAQPAPIAKWQPVSPSQLDHVVAKCLKKDPDERWQSSQDLKTELQWVADRGAEIGVPTHVAQHGKNRELAWALAAVVFFVAAAALALVHFRERSRQVQAVRFTVSPPEKSSFDAAMALSPDGTRLALVVMSDGKQSLWIRRLDSVTAQPLAGTNGADYPFWSPDGKFVAFFANRKLMKIEVAGGPATSLCDALDGRTGAWNQDGVIIFPGGGPSGGGMPLHRVSAEGGTSTPVTTLDLSRKEDTHRYPQFLPDGRHFLYWAQSLAKLDNASIYVDSLDSKPGSSHRKRLFNSNWKPAYVPATNGNGGYLLFIREGTLMAQHFDPDRLELSGEALRVAERVTDPDPNSLASYSVSGNGVLAHWTTSSATSQLAWFDHTGNLLGMVGEPGRYINSPSLSPDQKRLIVERLGKDSENSDLWLFDLSRKTGSRFTFDPGVHRQPIWSPDGTRVVFASNREGVFKLYAKAANGIGGEQPILKANSDAFPWDWSRDGRFIVYGEVDPKTRADIWVLPLEDGRKPFPFLRTEFNELPAAFSPNGRWLAYASDETGKAEVYVRTFTGQAETEATGGKWLVSTNGGDMPRWRGDGRELYYVAADGKIMELDVKSSATFEAGSPRPILQTSDASILNTSMTLFHVTADGQRFIVNNQVGGQRSEFVNVVLNWQAELKR